MEDSVYKDMIDQEQHHWWFKARKEILQSHMNNLNLPKNAKILEIGCGTGGNIKMLQKYGKVKAIEMDTFALNYALNTGVEIKQGSLPHHFPFNEKFDLICMFDVLEHIEEDLKTLEVIQKYLNPLGVLFITVPAYQWLYGSHDRMLHHKRRYNKKSLQTILHKSKFKIQYFSFFNTFLFPFVLVSRILDILKKSNQSIGYSIPNKILNKFFYTIFRSENKFLKFISFPYGTSLLVISTPKK